MLSGKNNNDVQIAVENLEMSFGNYVVQRNVNFSIHHGEIFIIMGGSGCGKSTLMNHLVGLNQPSQGDIYYHGINFWRCDEEQQADILHHIGVMFQSGALLSSRTLAENIGLPLFEYTDLSFKQIKDIVSYKLSLVGLSGFEDFYPSEISGGMAKRAGIARAIALDPEIVFFDEPSAGLDPVSAQRLDELILTLRQSLGATIVIVTHELASIFSVADNSIFLDADSKTIIAAGDPKRLLTQSTDPKVHEFLTRGDSLDIEGSLV